MLTPINTCALPLLLVSIRQPWASAIMNGPKRIENRTWAPHITAPFLLGIHASKTLDSEIPRNDLVDAGWNACPELEDLPRGCILGVALFEGYALHEHTAPDIWASGPLCWRLSPLSTVEPIPYAGRLGLWLPEPDIQTRLRAGVPEIVMYEFNP